MYLKSVEVYGFKSFANKVKISLTPGITAIVGPNGCGKSNVVDGIKWCIGEMSWKSLRMPSMMDVIFAGTTKRQPLNMAEVTLTFDNQERKLNFDFNEVAVTRKIYRSEESEYFINRADCRLRDIRDMFLDTGIGTDGYAIIDQGEVEEILSATAEERRELFEEVAGVSKYKSKREEALKRIEKVEYDLSVLSSSMQIIDEQIKKLDAEAKKARLQQKYREELREAEIALMAKEIKANKAAVEGENSALKPIADEIAEINSGVSAIEGETAALNISLTEKTDEEKQLLENWSNVKSNITRIEGNIVKDQGLIEEIAKQLSDLDVTERKNAELQARLSPLLDENRKKLESVKNSFGAMKTEYENSLNLLRDLESRMSGIDAELGEKEKNISFVYQQELEITGRVARLESETTNLKGEAISLTRDKEELAARKNEILERKNAETSKRAELRNNLENLAKKAEELSSARDSNAAKITGAEETLSSLNSRIVSGRSRLETILSQAEKDTYWVGLNTVLGAQIPGVRGSLRHLIKFDKEDRVLVEDSLGKFLDAVIVDGEAAALKCIEHLKYTGKGRSRFIILDRIPHFAPEEDSQGLFRVLNRVSCQDEYSALLKYLLRNVFYREDSVSGDFWIAGGVSQVASNEPYWGETDQLKSEIDSAAAEFGKLSAEKADLAGKNAAIDEELKKNSEAISSLRIELSNSENFLARHDEELELNAKNAELAEKEFAEKAQAQAVAEEKINGSRVELENVRKNSEDIKNASAGLKNRRAETEKRNLSLKEETGFKASAISSFQKDMESLENNVRIDEQRMNEIGSEKSGLENKRKEFSLRTGELKKAIETYKVQGVEERNNLKDLEIRKTQIGMAIEELRTNSERLNHKLKENKEILDENLKKKQEIEIKINTFETKNGDLIARLSNDWQVNYGEVRDKYENFETDAERVSFLRKRIENMGAVNMTAPQEYDALVSRYGLMTSQVDDLNSAKTDLKTAINRINDTTRDNFRKTFDKVQGYFKKIYSTLFNGGEANLILTNPDNLLETGVEIMAHPPGKKLVHISQLSGGEKSLTALALLFSFFCVSPSPFCIMDEVDAALDEANVDRFVRLIKEFAANTQFMVITHNKRTMEAADVMYGVTMEELGVSKMISVDLKRAVDMSNSKVPVGVK